MPSPLRQGFGPTLPALLRDRFGIAPRTTAIVALVAAVIVVIAVVAGVRVAADEQLVHEGEPTFNLLYDDGALREVEPQGSELVRLEGRRHGAFVAVAVRPLRLPPYSGDVGKGLLPVEAERYMTRLAERDPTFVIRDEGRSTVNDAPGYQFAYRTGTPGDYTDRREIFVVPDEEESPRLGAVLSFTNRRSRRLGRPGRRFVQKAKSAFRSFRFGTDRG